MGADGGMLDLAARVRVLRRAVAGVLVLIVSVPLYYLAAPVTCHNPVPRWFFAALLRALGVRVRVEGESTPGQRVLIANHLSWLDIPALTATTGTAFVAHAGLAQSTVLRWLCRMNRTVFVERNDRGSVADQIEQVREAMAESGVLTIFPEGTTDGGVTLLPFKSSLLAALDCDARDVAIQPVWIDYGAAAPEIAWVGDEAGLANVRRVLARNGPLNLTIHLLPVLTGEARRDRKTIAAAARQAIADRMAQRVAL
jgi:1-acyl-sn-glycerol-3-phosphate acyltransferase